MEHPRQIRRALEWKKAMKKIYVSKSTRAGFSGRLLRCPHCNEQACVYHLSWSALNCTGCKADVEKEHWLDWTAMIQRMVKEERDKRRAAGLIADRNHREKSENHSEKKEEELRKERIEADAKWEEAFSKTRGAFSDAKVKQDTL